MDGIHSGKALHLYQRAVRRQRYCSSGEDDIDTEGGVEEDGFDTEDGNQEDGFETEGGSEIGRFRHGRW